MNQHQQTVIQDFEARMTRRVEQLRKKRDSAGNPTARRDADQRVMEAKRTLAVLDDCITHEADRMGGPAS